MASSPPFYITTPIYYVNARPHLGHAYTTITADVACRFHSMRDTDTFFLTGTDEHGDKIVRAAKKDGLSPRTYVDRISGQFKDLWPQLNISHDRFIRTTDPAHMAVVEKILQKIHDEGDIYFSEYEGMYCYGCERFYTERELVDGKCPDHQTEPEVIREANYFFRMSRYQEWLVDHIREHPDFIRPERFKKEVLSFLKDPLEDLCISRPKSRLKWGISLPFDDRYVTYVWFDALINYVSALGYPDGEDFAKYWPSAQHIVAKDILKPHGIYWPIMLKAAGIPVYQHLNVHGYWNVDESKMSKSLGNVADPLAMKNVYGLDAFRFFLMREMAFGLDANFSEDALVNRINSDLANDLGNLFSRVLAMSHKYLGGTVPAVEPGVERELDLGLWGEASRAIDAYEPAMAEMAFHKGLAAAWELVRFMNKAVDLSAPWELAKRKSRLPHLEAVLYQFLEGLRIISGLLYPVMPETAATMQRYLGLDPEADPPFYLLDRLRTWGVLPAGTRLPKSRALFPRIEPKRESSESTGAPEEDDAEGKGEPIKPEITIDVLETVDLRVARVIKAEPVPRAKKLVKLELDLGAAPRTVVAGIAGTYAPEDLVGKQVIVVANLKPAKLMGILSNGMVLAATDDDGPSLATVDREIPPGTPLR